MQACRGKPASVSAICQEANVNVRTWRRVFVELQRLGYIGESAVVGRRWKSRSRKFYVATEAGWRWLQLQEGVLLTLRELFFLVNCRVVSLRILN